MSKWYCYDPDTGIWFTASIDTQTLADAIQSMVDSMTETAQEIANLIQAVIDEAYETFESLSETFDSLKIHFSNRPRYPMVRKYSKCKTPDRNLIWKPRVKARSRL